MIRLFRAFRRLSRSRLRFTVSNLLIKSISGENPLRRIDQFDKKNGVVRLKRNLLSILMGVGVHEKYTLFYKLLDEINSPENITSSLLFFSKPSDIDDCLYDE